MIYRFDAIFLKIPMTYLTEIENPIVKFIMESHGTLNSQAILKKMNKVGGLKPSDFKTYYKSTVIKTVC